MNFMKNNILYYLWPVYTLLKHFNTKFTKSFMSVIDSGKDETLH